MKALVCKDYAPLEKLAMEGKTPLARVHAICTLDGLESLDTSTLEKALADAREAYEISSDSQYESWIDYLAKHVRPA